MQGKARQCAEEVRLQGHEVDAVLAHPPPLLELDRAKLANAKWFNKRWLVAHFRGDACSRICAAHLLSVQPPQPTPPPTNLVVAYAKGRLRSFLSLWCSFTLFLQPCRFAVVCDLSALQAYMHARPPPLAPPPFVSKPWTFRCCTRRHT